MIENPYNSKQEIDLDNIQGLLGSQEAIMQLKAQVIQK